MLKSTFSGLQRCGCRQGLISFVQLLLPPKSAKSREILRKFELIAVQGHPRSSISVPVESAYNFLLVINSNFGRISYRFRDIDV